MGVSIPRQRKRFNFKTSGQNRVYPVPLRPKSGTFLFQCSLRRQDAIWLANAGHHPTMATFPPGRPDFGYLTLKRCPTIIRHCLKMAGLFDHIGPTAHHVPSEFHPSSSLCYRRRRTRTICLMSIIWFSRPQSTESFLPLSLQPKSHLSTALSLLPTKNHLITAAVCRDRSWATLPTSYRRSTQNQARFDPHAQNQVNFDQ